jgi:hypothetical protein
MVKLQVGKQCTYSIFVKNSSMYAEYEEKPPNNFSPFVNALKIEVSDNNSTNIVVPSSYSELLTPCFEIISFK